MVGGVSQRVEDEVKDIENRVWRDISCAGKLLLPYMVKGGVFITFDGKHLTGKELEKHMKEEYIPWRDFQIGDMKIIEVDLMAAVVHYDVVATREEPTGLKTYRMFVSSTWRQEASADWFCCSHQQTWA